MFIVVTLLSAYFISIVWTKYWVTPMIITLDSEFIDVKELAFPGNTFKYVEFRIIMTWNSLLIRLCVFIHSFHTCTAVTLCTMNLANKTVVKSIPKQSHEYKMVKNLCEYGTSIRTINDKNKTRVNSTVEAADKWEPFRDLIIKVNGSLYLFRLDRKLFVCFLLSKSQILSISLYLLVMISRWQNRVTDYCYGVHMVELTTTVAKFSWQF